MSERGVFAIDRGIWDHPMFADEPFTEREAWSWLIGEASFKARMRNIGGKAIPLERGQLAASVRFMAERWKWSKSRVDRFVHRLKTETMIGTGSGTGILVITICNYDRYQRVSLPDRDSARDSSRDSDGTAAGQQRDKLEDTKNIKTIEYSEANASGADAPPDPSEPERQFFKRGREILGKSAGGQIAKLLKAAGGNVALARSKLELAATKDNPMEWITKVILHAHSGAAPSAKPLTAHQRERETTRSILDELDQFISGGGGKADLGLLRHDPGGGSAGIHGGVRGDVIDLSTSRVAKGD